MKADVFYLSEQENQIAEIRKILRAQLYPEISVELRKIEIPSRTPETGIALGEQYVKLLQAAVPPETGLKLNVVRLESYGTRFYISVYYPFVSFWGAYRDSGLRGFFPAVAIQDRMVLIPQGLGKLLRGTDDSPLFRPFEFGGVIEVKFDDGAALAGAVQKFARSLRSEVITEVAASCSYQESPQIDLAGISKDLGLDLGYVKHCLKQECVERAVYRQLTCELDAEKVALGRWTKVSLLIKNNSDAALSDLRLTISGPIRLLPARIQTDIPAGGTRSVQLAVMPEAPGDFPLEITLFVPEDRMVAGWLPVHHVWLQCE